jgi:ankyrin repeat protein
MILNLDRKAMVADQAAGIRHGHLPLTAAPCSETQDVGQDDRMIPSSDPSTKRAGFRDTIRSKLQLVDSIAHISSPTGTGQELSLDFDSHHYLFLILYLVSNSHVILDRSRQDYEVDLGEIVETIMRCVSKQVLLPLFQSRLPSVKAAWQKLLSGAGYHKNQEAFRLLIRVGIENNWLDEAARGHDHLYNAARCSCTDLVDTLLARGCRADTTFETVDGILSWSARLGPDTAIMEAIRNGDIGSAKLLIQSCDVNREIEIRSPFQRTASTNFACFIAKFGCSKINYCCLEYFLEKDVDVDCEIGRVDMRSSAWSDNGYWDLPSARRINIRWPLSILDYVYYFHRPLFPRLAAFSKPSPLFSRAKALWSLEQGVQVLREYLYKELEFPASCTASVSRPGETSDFPGKGRDCLETLLAEQFLLGMYTLDRTVCFETVQGLLELGVSLKSLSTRRDLATDILHATARLILYGGDLKEQKGLHLLRLLLDHGFEVQADTLLAAIKSPTVYIRGSDLSISSKDHGTAMLKFLAGFCSDTKNHGVKALAQAVSDNNFEAVDFLLQEGVDPNSSVDKGSYTGDTVFAAAALYSSFAMMTYLVRRGSNRSIWQQEGNSFKGLETFFLHNQSEQDLFVKAQYLIEDCITITDPCCPSSYLLELSLALPRGQAGLMIFEHLLKKGAKLNPGSPLACWIGAGGGCQLVQEMLDAGADPNALSLTTVHTGLSRQTALQAASRIGDYTLVLMLLDHGADVNRPAPDEHGYTALHGICAWDPIRPEERTRKDRIIQLFLAKGADVNSTNASGATALFHAARIGDLSTAFILLTHGAKIDAVGKFYFTWRTALDIAAQYGRLDMVEFLLNAGALSCSACSGGEQYDEAIRLARLFGHTVIAELICEYSMNRTRWDVPRAQPPGVEAKASPPRTAHSLSLRPGAGAAPLAEMEAQTTAGENFEGVPVPKETNNIRSAFDECIVESSTATSQEKSTGATEMDLGRAIEEIEEIEDESSLVDAVTEEHGEENQGTANLALEIGTALPGPGVSQHQWAGQEWVEGEQQNFDPVVSTGLVTDIFMGFSDFSSQ